MTKNITKNEVSIIRQYLECRLAEVNAEVWDRAARRVGDALDDPNVSEDEKWKIKARSGALHSIAYGIENELDFLNELEKGF